jgi:predicted Zn-dependent peptidase
MRVQHDAAIRTCVRLVTLALCAGSAPLARCAEPASGVELFRLANGMRWIAAPMASPGEVTLVFYVATGTAHEPPAARGSVPTLVELWRLGSDGLAARGAAASAYFANPDFTVARATWPSKSLEDAVSHAARQWSTPDTTRFAEARSKAVSRRDQALRGRLRLYWEMCRAAYAVHPYGRPYFGEPGELERLGEEAFRGHLAAHLVPANIVGVVTGEFDGAALHAAAEREFGSQPPGSAPAATRVIEPPQQMEKRVALSDAAVSGLAIGFHKAAGAAPGIAAWGVLADVWKRRVEERTAAQKGLIRSFDAEQGPAMKDPNLVFALWETDPAADLRAIEQAALEEWQRLAREPLGQHELEQAKQRLAGDSEKPDARTRGQHIADWLVMTGDIGPAFAHTARVRAVTADQVLALAREGFRPENRTVVTAGGPSAPGRD